MRFRCFGRIKTANFLTIVLWLFIDLVFQRRDFNVILSWAKPTRKTIDTDLEKGYTKTLTKKKTADQAKCTWCLPHHLVLNPNKPGQVRRVCYAAAKYQGSSLNSHLVSGPDLLNNLVVIFMGFIEEKIAFSGDIKRQCLTKLLSHQRIKLPSVFRFHRSLKSKSISTCDILLGLSVHQSVLIMPF